MQQSTRPQVNPNAIIVSRRQEGNPVLHHIRSVRWQYGDIVPDYQMGPYTCALFLSLRCRSLPVACVPLECHCRRSKSCDLVGQLHGTDAL